jgi:hypothetical protein
LVILGGHVESESTNGEVVRVVGTVPADLVTRVIEVFVALLGGLKHVLGSLPSLRVTLVTECGVVPGRREWISLDLLGHGQELLDAICSSVVKSFAAHW